MTKFSCKGCKKPIIPGEMRRGDNWHADCFHKLEAAIRGDGPNAGPMRRKAKRSEQDIKAPDGFTLGGMRKVRADATLLFGRRYWRCPSDWIGKRVWVHVTDGWGTGLEAAPPGIHIFDARALKGDERERSVVLVDANKPEAKPCYRRPENRAWVNRERSDPLTPEKPHV